MGTVKIFGTVYTIHLIFVYLHLKVPTHIMPSDEGEIRQFMSFSECCDTHKSPVKNDIQPLEEQKVVA